MRNHLFMALIVANALGLVSCISDSKSDDVVTQSSALANSSNSHLLSQTSGSSATLSSSSQKPQIPPSSSDLMQSSQSGSSSSTLSSSASLSSSSESSKFNVYMHRYKWADMDMFGIRMENTDSRSYSNLKLYLYFKDRAGIDTVFGFFATKMQTYHTNGFVSTVSDSVSLSVHTALRYVMPESLSVVGGVINYRILIDLSSWEVTPGSVARLDIGLDMRSPWPPYLELMNARPDMTLEEGDYSFEAVPSIGIEEADVANWREVIPKNSKVLLQNGNTWLWGSAPP